MMNSTIFPTNSTSAEDWLITFGITLYSIFIAVDVWLLISLVHYGIKTEKWKHKQHSSRSEKLNTGLIYTSLICAVLVCLGYHILSVVYSRIGYDINDHFTCEFVSDLRRCFYALLISCVSIFLWLRQRVFYTTSMPNAMFGKPTKVFSFVIIFLIFAGVIISSVLTFLPFEHIPSPQGCISYSEEHSLSLGVYVGIATIIISQFSLLILFVNALLKTSQFNAFSCCNPGSRTNNSSSEKNDPSATPIDKTALVIQQIIRKTAIFAVLCLTSDILCLGLAIVISQQNGREDLTTILGSIDLFANVVFLVLSFISWKEMITSPFRNYSEPSEISRTRSGTTIASSV